METRDPKMTVEVLERFKLVFESDELIKKYYSIGEKNEIVNEIEITKNISSTSKTMTRQKRDRIIKLLKGNY